MFTGNILIINDFAYINGGAAQVALSSSGALAKRGYKVTVFSAVAPIMPGLTDSGAEVICTGQYEILKDPNRIRAAAQGIWNLKAARILSDKLDTLDKSNTIIHLHSWTKALSSGVVRVALRKGFKVICTLHDYFIACPNGGFFNYQKNKICSVKPLSMKCILQNCDVRNYPQKIWRISRQFVQHQFGLIPRRIRHFIFVSEFSHNILKSYLPSDANFYFVPNPLESVRNVPVEVARNTSYVAIGRLSKEKGVPLFAKAAKLGGFEAVFVGEGECRSNIERMYPFVKISGWVSRDIVNDYLSQARTLVFPSLWYETQGLVVSEAASRGVPAIVSDICAAKDMVEDRVTGLWFKSGNVNDLIDKMRMLQDGYLATRLGRTAYDRYWSDPHTTERHVADLLNVYQKVLQRDRRV